MPFFKYLPALIPALAVAVPAHASVGTPLPEPSGLLLLSLGVAGVVVGRHMSSKRGRD
ncbi:PEP-CTERM sorting domain-containing protein [Novosphingobium malaysiense]|uniref:Glycosyl transferase family 1 n=1 Tax=Novosphingobium malaysiense TaxID=1348853 RepID=A0A0B1ZLL1_9SPHN|nr:PEP-CTERM sorting domain-containing protein [Novosphingobium malaysiense]KHK90063.1 glycosyl transferase family 1 [Novosphingobium malaysiense]